VPFRLFFPTDPPIILYPNSSESGVCRSTHFPRFEGLKMPITCASNATVRLLSLRAEGRIVSEMVKKALAA